MGNHIIYRGDAIKRIEDIGEQSVHLVVTSPPYFNAKDYHQEDDNIGKNENYIKYLERITLLLRKLKRVMVPGGIVVWNTSPVIYEGKRYMIPHDTHQAFVKEGYECRDDITWAKPDGAAKLRCGGWVQNDGRPMTWHPNIVDEKLMVYTVPGERAVGKFEPMSKYYPERPKDLLTNVWYMNTETSTTWHDAPFPEELVKRCVVLYSYLGETVLDPFLGSGTTMKVARDLGRNSIGIELSDEYIEKAKEKLGFYQKSLFSTEVYEVK